MAEWKPFDLKWGRSIWYCSACEESTEVPTYLGTPMYNFCPMCGADMNMKSENKEADTPQTELTAKCLNCRNAKACKEKHWDGCIYEPQTDCDDCIWSVCNYNKADWDATCTDIVNIAAHVDCVTLQLKYAKVED